METLQGQFLIAAPTLLDPNFGRSVVLIVQHGEQGALGLILNRPTRATVADVREKVIEEREGPLAGPVHAGGPCEGPLMIVHDEESAADAQVVEGVHFTTEPHKLEWILRKHDGKALVFIGYSGWTAGQLEAEMTTNSWLVLPATAEEVFEESVDWHKLMTRAFVAQHVPLARIPGDASVN